jgi:hypothetical protein
MAGPGDPCLPQGLTQINVICATAVIMLNDYLAAQIGGYVRRVVRACSQL